MLNTWFLRELQKEAQNKLIKRAIAAVIVFLVVTFVSLLMNLIGSNDYKACTSCINNPWNCNGDVLNEIPES